jgi:hypothetical protein
MSAAHQVATRGVVFIHSAPASLCPHVAWALESALGHAVRLDWTPQPASPRLQRTEAAWVGPAGTGARIATALRGWGDIRYEITEEPSPGVDGSRWSHTPTLGIHHTWTAANGDAVIHEDRIRSAAEAHAHDAVSLQQAIDALLGGPWDRELEPFRYAGDGAAVRWLHKVG